MECNFSFQEINWFAVLVATVLAFAIGGLWYSPVLFSKIWQQELHLSNENIKKDNMPVIFGLAFVLNFISAIFLELILGTQASLWSGMATGFFISTVFIASSLGINYLFTQKSFKLFLIDAGYFVTYYTIMGAILGLWK